mmetsp:Transcript_77049/g.231163  ORF Transcript_77049/g.231163 Transcript_77049/m.231163 type:complete len:154 (-) Transcript_77049:295-756(-)
MRVSAHRRKLGAVGAPAAAGRGQWGRRLTLCARRPARQALEKGDEFYDTKEVQEPGAPRRDDAAAAAAPQPPQDEGRLAPPPAPKAEAEPPLPPPPRDSESSFDKYLEQQLQHSLGALVSPPPKLEPPSSPPKLESPPAPDDDDSLPLPLPVD